MMSVAGEAWSSHPDGRTTLPRPQARAWRTLGAKVYVTLPITPPPATPRRTLPPFPIPTSLSGSLIYEADKAVVKKMLAWETRGTPGDSHPRVLGQLGRWWRTG